MTHRNDRSLSPTIVEKISHLGLDGISEMIKVLINSAMQVEWSKHIRAGEYERIEYRKGHGNGFKPKMVRTSLGEITFTIP